MKAIESAGFDATAREVLSYLHERLGFDLWMVTRTSGEDWIVLQAEDHGYGVHDGKLFRWADSFCSRMVRNEGPRIAPRSADVPAYADAPIGRQVPIGAYVGAPIMLEGGELFGTLCAVHPSPQPPAVVSELPLVNLMAKLLSDILSRELKEQQLQREAERARAEAMTDALTGILNRRGWEHVLAAEESRCQRYGHPACVVSVDLNGLKQLNDTLGHGSGDELLRRAAGAIHSALRAADALARVGGDEFAVLSVECDAAGAEALLARISARLDDAGVDAAIGLAMRHPERGLSAALRQADEAMYQRKRARVSRRAA